MDRFPVGSVTHRHPGSQKAAGVGGGVVKDTFAKGGGFPLGALQDRSAFSEWHFPQTPHQPPPLWP